MKLEFKYNESKKLTEGKGNSEKKDLHAFQTKQSISYLVHTNIKFLLSFFKLKVNFKYKSATFIQNI